MKAADFFHCSDRAVSSPDPGHEKTGSDFCHQMAIKHLTSEWEKILMVILFDELIRL